MLFLTYDQILELHESILIPANPRGQSEERVRAIMGNIAGGIGEQLFHTTVLEAGNAYLYYFARDQAFVKGNKRTAVITCSTFLDVNGVILAAPIDTAVVWSIGKGQMTKDESLAYLNTIT